MSKAIFARLDSRQQRVTNAEILQITTEHLGHSRHTKLTQHINYGWLAGWLWLAIKTYLTLRIDSYQSKKNGLLAKSGCLEWCDCVKFLSLQTFRRSVSKILCRTDSNLLVLHGLSVTGCDNDNMVTIMGVRPINWTFGSTDHVLNAEPKSVKSKQRFSQLSVWIGSV